MIILMHGSDSNFKKIISSHIGSQLNVIDRYIIPRLIGKAIFNCSLKKIHLEAFCCSAPSRVIQSNVDGLQIQVTKSITLNFERMYFVICTSS
jgi:hypothetical protein